jgi:uncharacterized Zn-binding protein involved in type VI secretion
MKRTLAVHILALLAASPARAASPAARVGDTTDHGGAIVGPGVGTVRIEGQAAAVRGDETTCPLSGGNPPVPHVGGPIVTGSTTVFIGGSPAARIGDTNAENGASATINSGAGTVIIGP